MHSRFVLFVIVVFTFVSMALVAQVAVAAETDESQNWVVYQGDSGPGVGKHIVFIASDHEYRGEETCPAIARILAKRYGFKCTVLFGLDKQSKYIVAGSSNIPGMQAIETADLVFMAVRFAHPDDASMQFFEDYLNAGKPILGLRTTTHAFNGLKGKFEKYNYNYKGESYNLGFGRQVLGETWAGHYGANHKCSTRLDIIPTQANHPVLRGVKDMHCHAGAYFAKPMANSVILANNQVLETMDQGAPALAGKPPVPAVWVRTYEGASGKQGRVFCATQGASEDILNEGFRRLVINGAFWCLGLEAAIDGSADISFVGPFNPALFSFGGERKGVKPSDLAGWDSPLLVAKGAQLAPPTNGRIVLMGNGLGSRMLHFGHFETGIHLRFNKHKLIIRNMCDEGNTPSFRPHSGRKNQLGFPGAEAFHKPYCDGNTTDGAGHFETEEEWLHRLDPDIVFAFFGFNESFQGAAGIENYRQELDAFLKHTLKQKYNDKAPAQLVLVSPTAYEDLTATMDVPKGDVENTNLATYTAIMQEVAAANNVLFVDVYTPSIDWYKTSDAPLTVDGALLNETGYLKVSNYIIDTVFGKRSGDPEQKHANYAIVHDAVMEKNWCWINDFKVPNGVHVFGRRYKPYGPDNYPFEIIKNREMTVNRDKAIIKAAKHGKVIDLAALDAQTSPLPPVETNYTIDVAKDKKAAAKAGSINFLYGEDALKTIAVPDGYKIEQWATEQEFPDLQSPVQISFDNKGRCWVSVMPSYPHWKPGDAKPNDKILILEDTDGDGKADKQTTFADNLHVPGGFEITPEGVYVSEAINLVLLKDTDGDGKADVKEIILSGFDDHDTHHGIGAFCADPSGAIIMCEGVFLRSNIETAYGPVRGTNGGFFRYSPQRKHLERHAQLSIPNPWGVAFDDWGQHFFLHTSGASIEWMLPGSVKPRYGVATPSSRALVKGDHSVRPTSGIEFMSSRHFPDEVQGDMMLNNCIGFLGTKQHQMIDDGTGYRTEHRQDLTSSTDGNYRPVDLETAPDGSLYIVDWHNPLIGHMQHNARDPHRDSIHGRIYRVTYPSRPLVTPAKIDGATIATLLDNLTLPEYRSRYRTRRELRGRDVQDVLPALNKWVSTLDKSDSRYEHHLLEALWVTWGLNKIDERLLTTLLSAKDYRVRAAATGVLRYSGHQIAKQPELLKLAANDEHGRVRLSAIVAASWIDQADGLAVLDVVHRKTEKVVTEGIKEVTIDEIGREIKINAAALTTQKVDQIKIGLYGKPYAINLGEIEVYSGGINVANTAKVSQSTEYNNGQFPAKLLVDGNKGSFNHTKAQSRNPWVKLQFETPINIEQVVIYNRIGFESRFEGAYVEFIANKDVIAKTRVKLQLSDILDPWIAPPYNTAKYHLNNQAIKAEVVKLDIPKHLKGKSVRKQYAKGAEIYKRDGHCATCHQVDGKGLPAAGFPPIAGTKWTTGSEERIIKIALNGMFGEIEVAGNKYPGLVPMTGFGGLLDDEELASVLTYVRNAFGNKASAISAKQVEKVRRETKTFKGFYKPDDLLKLHPYND